MGNKFRILIADDQILFRRGLVTLLAAENDLEAVAEVASFDGAMTLARSMVPDLLVMNIALLENSPEMEVETIRQVGALVPVLFLAAENRGHYADLVARAGGCGLLLKNSTAAELVAGICRAFRSDPQNGRALGSTAADLQALAHSNERYVSPTALTAREQEILKLLAEGRTVRETAAELSLSMKTVEAHKLNLMRKLDIHNRATLIEFAAATGIIQPVAR